MRATNVPNPGLVEHVADMSLDANIVADIVDCDCPDKATKLMRELVGRSVVNYQAIFDGEPLGATRMSPEGHVAKRVVVDGIHKWRVIYADGSVGLDQRPSLPDWELIAPKSGE